MSQVTAAPCVRRHVRVQTRLRVGYGVGAIDRKGYAESISEGGLYINTNEVFKVGTRLIVRIEFPERTVFQRGEVVWAIGVPEHLKDSMVCGMGISFTHADPRWQKFFAEWKSGAAATR